MTGRLRGSVMIAGPMLARFKKAYVPKPGGDKIGRRRLDTHIIGFQKLGAEFNYDADAHFFICILQQLKGAHLLLEEPSVTGTANLIMAAVMATGTTTIYNAACEPYIQQLCKMLNSMGAKISGIASNMLSIEGVKEMHGTTHTILPDMIEVGSFIGLAAMTQSDITIKNAGIDHLGIIPERFQQLGIKMNFTGDDIHIPAAGGLRGTNISGWLDSYHIRSSMAGIYARSDQHYSGSGDTGQRQCSGASENV